MVRDVGEAVLLPAELGVRAGVDHTLRADGHRRGDRVGIQARQEARPCPGVVWDAARVERGVDAHLLRRRTVGRRVPGDRRHVGRDCRHHCQLQEDFQAGGVDAGAVSRVGFVRDDAELCALAVERVAIHRRGVDTRENFWLDISTRVRFLEPKLSVLQNSPMTSSVQGIFVFHPGKWIGARGGNGSLARVSTERCGFNSHRVHHNPGPSSPLPQGAGFGLK